MEIMATAILCMFWSSWLHSHCITSLAASNLKVKHKFCFPKSCKSYQKKDVHRRHFRYKCMQDQRNQKCALYQKGWNTSGNYMYWMNLSQLQAVCLGYLTSNYTSKCTGIASKEGRKIWHNILKQQTNILQKLLAKHPSRKVSAKSNSIVPQRNSDFSYMISGRPIQVKQKIPAYQSFLLLTYNQNYYRLLAQNTTGHTN